MKIYIATRLANAKRHQKLSQFLRSCGYKLTFDWTQEENELTAKHTFNKKTLKRHASNDFGGVAECDVCIVLLRGGLGTHVELGIALGMGKRIIIVGDQKMYKYSCLFYNCDGIVRMKYNKNLYTNIVNQLLAWAVIDSGGVLNV